MTAYKVQVLECDNDE